MKNKFYQRKAQIFKALANPVRLEVIDTLLNGEKCVCEIVEELKEYEQPHISKSLSKLKEAGLIQDRKDGLNVYYSLRICCMGEFFSCLNEILQSNYKK
ncbi:transcriptional regulator ArsR family [Clostridium sp. CAG:967]|nr:transcriptional regulator ArsR family [Clostridium sp. CAG:967]